MCVHKLHLSPSLPLTLTHLLSLYLFLDLNFLDMSAEEKESNAIMNLSKLSLSCRILGQAAFPTLLLEDIRISGKYGTGTYNILPSVSFNFILPY